ncbi:MAG: DMT family transporter [Atribacterota bacterium]
MKKQVCFYGSTLSALILLASGSVYTKIAMEYFTAPALTFIRFFFASIFIAMYLVYKKAPLPKFKDVPYFFLMGASGFALYMCIFNLAIKSVSAATAGFFIATSPVITAIMARVLLKEKIGVLGCVSVFISFCGIIIITLWNGILSINTGTLWLVLAVTLFSFYNILQRKIAGHYSPLIATAYSLVTGTIIMLPFLPEAYSQLIDIPNKYLIISIYLGVFPTGIAYSLWSVALHMATKTSQASNFLFLTPLITTLLEVIILGVLPHASLYIGGILVLAGLVLMGGHSHQSGKKSQAEK